MHQAFESCQKKESDKLHIPDLIDFCLVNPEAKSWLDHFSDAEETDPALMELLESEADYSAEAKVGRHRYYKLQSVYLTVACAQVPRAQ